MNMNEPELIIARRPGMYYFRPIATVNPVPVIAIGDISPRPPKVDKVDTSPKAQIITYPKPLRQVKKTRKPWWKVLLGL